MKQDDPQFKFRMPADLKVRLDAAAEKNTRTLGAEIVDRLQRSADLIDELALLRATHAYDQAVNTGLMREKGELLAQLAKKDAEIQILKQRLFLGTVDVPEVTEGNRSVQAKDAGDVLYILLDAHGYPISWSEIKVYLEALKDSSGLQPENLEISIITPDMEANSNRTKQVMVLAKKLRGSGISQAIGRATRKQILNDQSKGIEDASINAMTVPITVRGKKTQIKIRPEREQILDSSGKHIAPFETPFETPEEVLGVQVEQIGEPDPEDKFIDATGHARRETEGNRNSAASQTAVNKVILVGNLGRDPNINYMPPAPSMPKRRIPAPVKQKMPRPPKSLGLKKLK